MLIEIIAIVAIVARCSGYERDENYYINENDTIVNIFVKTMDLSDYKVPAVDSIGLSFIAKMMIKCYRYFKSFRLH